MQGRQSSTSEWSIDDIPFAAIERDRIRDDEDLFHLLASASFVEFTADLFTRNLVEYFAGDAEIVAWVRDHWRQEELRHGAALRRYVLAVWPDFPWQEAYDRFLVDYARFCTVERLGPSRALEMVARCVVETGTAASYRALAAVAPEPVLRVLAAHIASDEVGHFGHFLRFYRRFREAEGTGRVAVARTLARRVAEIDDEDLRYAFEHVYRTRHPERVFDGSVYRAHRRRISARARDRFPYPMAVRMFVRPLALGPVAERLTRPVLTVAARRLLAH